MAPAPKTNTPTPAPAAGKPEKAEKAARKPAAADESKPKKAAAPVAAEPKKAAAAAVAAEPKKAAAAAVAAPVVDAGAATVKPSATSKLVDNMDILDAELVKQDELINSLLKQSRAVKELRKSIGRHSINAKKAEGVRVAKVLKRKALPHKGLNDPTLASDTMNNFLGNAPGTKVPRQQAYAAIRAYIDAHGLKAGAPSGFAKVDAKLGKLFVGMTEFKVFSIQTHLKDHFAKKDQAAPVAK
jgi:hypothetical protein